MRGFSITHHFRTFIFFIHFIFFPSLCLSVDTLTVTESLTIRTHQTLVSTGQSFELGFFPGPNPNHWYLGIWYKNIPKRTYVWVANRDNPITNSSATLQISDHNIVIVSGNQTLLWSSNHIKTTVDVNRNLVAQLLDNGNFVLKQENEDNPENFLWQSFDYPTDALLPGMKLGWDKKSGLNRYLTSWKTPDDPSTGEFTFQMNFKGFPEILLASERNIIYRSGPWNGIRFSGVPEMKPLDYIIFSFVSTADEVSYSSTLTGKGKSIFSRLVVNPSGVLERLTWIEESQIWIRFWYAPKDQCDNYLECGPYGLCDANKAPVCSCPKGFEPKNIQAWNLRDGSDGCKRKSKLNCDGDGFLKLNNVKLPDSNRTMFLDRGMSLKECEEVCLRNCSCVGYANVDIKNGGSGCVMWSGELSDIRVYPAGGQDLFLRVVASVLAENGRTNGEVIVGVSISACVGILLLGLIACCLWKRKTLLNKINRKPERGSEDFVSDNLVIARKGEYSCETESQELELPLLDFETVAIATDNFNEVEKLGQGGFGSVYMGRLINGQEIAVKRLSKTSVQGVEEFKNEVRLIARLQHRNLVRLLACCVETNEKILIYEYMENRSLDSTLFNKSRSHLLTWPARFNIICGIARGILYLHEDSRFRIIHRDLKASNVLLDGNMNPKISDFGMARIFGGDQTEANTRRVVGTYGYMSPEYAMDGIFSAKSDVFSFGVLVLEIISGMKNRGFYNANSDLNLLNHTWRFWNEGKWLEIVDPVVGEAYPPQEVSRCIQVGLLCVQEHAEDRPTMASIVLMLSSETAAMARPKAPGFCVGRSPFETESSSSRQQDDSCTGNQVTVTMLEAR